MIVCWRTVHVPADQRPAFIRWIDDNAALRLEHGAHAAHHRSITKHRSEDQADLC